MRHLVGGIVGTVKGVATLVGMSVGAVVFWAAVVAGVTALTVVGHLAAALWRLI
jgi:hypothetical protein